MIVRFDQIKVKALLNKRDISIEQLRSALGMSATGIYKILEKGNTHEEKVKRMAEFLDVPIADILHPTLKNLYNKVEEPQEDYKPRKYIEQRVELLEETVKRLENVISELQRKA